MAVKLILVVLLVAVVASGLAQQSSDSQRTGGEDSTRTDRRLNNLRRFRNRNRSNKETENSEARESGRGAVSRSRLANQDKIAERRRELLQRNGVSRRRKVVKTEVNEIPEEQTKAPVQNIRIRTTTKKSIEVIPVERITNNDQEIISAALDYEVEEEKTPFSGLSEVRPVSRPSGFRSSNEQIVSVKFVKKTTAAPEEEKDFAPTQAPRRRFQPNRNLVRKGLLGRRPATPEIETTTKVILLSQASDALKALLQTANANEAVEVPAEVNTNAVDEDLPEEAEAAVLEMEEDNGHIKATPAPRGRARGDRRRVRVNTRGRGQQKPKTEDSEDTEAPRQSPGSRGDRFRSFPARQGGGRNIGRRPSGNRNRIVTPRTQTTQRVEAVEVVAPVTEAATEATRFESRPTVSAPVVNTPARIPDFKIFDDFEGFTFPTPVRAPPTSAPQAAEVPRSQASPAPVPGQSQFTLQQNFVPRQPQQFAPAPTPAPVPQPQQAQPQPVPVQRPQTPLRPASLPQAVPARQAVPQQQTVFAQQPQQPQQPAQPQRVQPFVSFNNQQFQPLTPRQPQPQAAAPAANRFQPQAAAAPQQQQAGSFNLLNPSNFQAFDAQFGGSVPTNNARPVSASNIFAQPQSALLQGRDVLVNPFSGQQQPTVFGQQQNLFGQQPATSNNFQAFRSG